jgi:Phospholipase_D-nuclease N-terminal
LTRPSGHLQVKGPTGRRAWYALWRDADGRHQRRLGPAHGRDSGRPHGAWRGGVAGGGTCARIPRHTQAGAIAAGRPALDDPAHGHGGVPTREERAMSGLWQVVAGVLGVALLVIWTITIWDIVRSHLGGGKTAAWLLIVIVLPFVGSILYWVMRKPQGDEVERQYENELALREARAHRPIGP